MKVDLPDLLVHLDETLDHDHLAAIETDLRQDSGVVSVAFHDDRPHVMVVAYDPKVTTERAILGRVTAEGVHAELAGL